MQCGQCEFTKTSISRSVSEQLLPKQRLKGVQYKYDMCNSPHSPECARCAVDWVGGERGLCVRQSTPANKFKQIEQIRP
ncbi:hypothetical protein NECAME_05996 [Necator americanus]|uniref:Uncharacterized protein n=1 Tax=Necator americanus TaxID=51031 RepID=W2TZ96_NECAM|nr:hypothetical protein NECAME_05996 [Necator americanus]ETN86381.1 hypothetical protein NECAME_05996 [Necator americanus]